MSVAVRTQRCYCLSRMVPCHLSAHRHTVSQPKAMFLGLYKPGGRCSLWRNNGYLKHMGDIYEFKLGC